MIERGLFGFVFCLFFHQFYAPLLRYRTTMNCTRKYSMDRTCYALLKRSDMTLFTRHKGISLGPCVQRNRQPSMLAERLYFILFIYFYSHVFCACLRCKVVRPYIYAQITAYHEGPYLTWRSCTRGRSVPCGAVMETFGVMNVPVHRPPPPLRVLD